MAKYTHYIIVPMSTSISLAVESDEDIVDDQHAFDLAMGEMEKAGTRFEVMNEEIPGAVEFGEEIAFHKHMNRGNYVVAACPEISWETEKDDSDEG